MPIYIFKAKPDEATSELATPDGSPNRELGEARRLSAAE